MTGWFVGTMPSAYWVELKAAKVSVYCAGTMFWM